MKDWRKDYTICEHVKKETKELRHSGFRVCCEDCFTGGFLEKEISIISEKPLAIAKIKEPNTTS